VNDDVENIIYQFIVNWSNQMLTFGA
jgi:hypothetical protein